MARKARYIQNPDKPKAIQLTLHAPPGVKEDPVSPWPYPILDPIELIKIVQIADEAIGYDLEFYDRYNKEERKVEYIPTVIGIAGIHEGKRYLGACKWNEQLARDIWEVVKERSLKVVAYSLTGADKPVTEGAIGESIPLDIWEDSMVIHHLDNPDFCKMPSKDEDEDDVGAMGLMNLWTAASMVTDYPQWKECRGKACVGPCPKHDVMWYCAMDALAGLEIYFEGRKNLHRKGISTKLYREQVEIGDILEKMSLQGVRIDREWIAELEVKSDEKKALLFPHEEADGEIIWKDFNPRSPDQIMKWASKTGLSLPSGSKPDIEKLLSKEARKIGVVDTGKKLISALENHDDGLQEPLATLFRLYQYKTAGKGLASWFDDRYISKDGLAHPRFNHTGTSMGRLSSSNPNFQNIPARGFGALVRRAVMPVIPGYDWIKVDYSNLELRMCLYLAGVDPKDIPKDAFMWMVEKAKGAFKPASELLQQTERQTAKSVMHAYDYMEGITVLSTRDLMSSRTKAAIDYGALRVYAKRYNHALKHDWEYGGGIVAFTGANLAERLFGNKTYDSRRKALEMQEDIITVNFPMLREWQWTVLQEIESSGMVKNPVGWCLPLYGSPEDNAKMATAMKGQGTSAMHVMGMLLKLYKEQGLLPLLQVHDELDFQMHPDLTNQQIIDTLWTMRGETDRLPGFVSAMSIKRGKHWLEYDDKNPATHIEGSLKEIFKG